MMQYILIYLDKIYKIYNIYINIIFAICTLNLDLKFNKFVFSFFFYLFPNEINIIVAINLFDCPLI